MKKISITFCFCLILVSFLMPYPSDDGKSTPNVSTSTNIYPSHIKITKSDDGISTNVHFRINGDIQDKIKINAYTIPKNDEYADLVYPKDWLDTGTEVILKYERKSPDSSSPSIVVVIELTNTNNKKRTWSVSFSH